jgi:hypothetical protein
MDEADQLLDRGFRPSIVKIPPRDSDPQELFSGRKKCSLLYIPMKNMSWDLENRSYHAMA